MKHLKANIILGKCIGSNHETYTFNTKNFKTLQKEIKQAFSNPGDTIRSIEAGMNHRRYLIEYKDPNDILQPIKLRCEYEILPSNNQKT